MLQKIKRLERAASVLEPAGGDRERMTAQVVDYAQAFLSRLPSSDAFEPETGRSQALDRAFSETASGLGELLRTLDGAVMHEGINAASGGLMGYIPGGGIYPAALGDFLADVSNRYSGVSFASPGASRLEQQLVRWMAELIGYPGNAGGDLTSGGSIANLTAIVAARETMGVRARDVESGCVYLTADAHHCIDKALRAAGLAECNKRVVPMDGHFRMDAAELERMVRADEARGLRPWLLVVSAGTTDTGAVDPIEAAATVAENHDMWLHADAAYGGFFLLCEEGRKKLAGLKRANSVVLDPHKGMFLPYGSGAVLVRDVEWLAASHAYQADYMQDAEPGRGQYSPADLSLELTRPFRGLRFWLPLKLFGLAPFRAALEEKIWLARYFYARLESAPGWEMGPFPDLSVVTFRFLPGQGDPDAFNQRLLRAVHADGKVFISSTRMNGRFVLRLAVLHFRTHLGQVDYLLDFLARKSSELAAG